MASDRNYEAEYVAAIIRTVESDARLIVAKNAYVRVKYWEAIDRMAKGPRVERFSWHRASLRLLKVQDRLWRAYDAAQDQIVALGGDRDPS